MRSLVGVTLGLDLATGAWAQTPPSDTAAVEVEKVELQAAARPVGGLMARRMRERGEEPKPTPGGLIEGHLAKPKGDGPFPALVVLPRLHRRYSICRQHAHGAVGVLGVCRTRGRQLDHSTCASRLLTERPAP